MYPWPDNVNFRMKFSDVLRFCSLLMTSLILGVEIGGEKWFSIIAKNIRKFSFPTHFLTSECHILYTLLKFLWRLPYQFWSSRGFNPRSVVPFCRVIVKTHWL